MKSEHAELCASLNAWAHDERLGSGALLNIAADAIRELSAEVERWYQLSGRYLERANAAEAELASLQERLKDAEKDAERLDWMDANPFTLYRSADPEDGRLYGHVTAVNEYPAAGGRMGHVRDTVREAIDSARDK